MNIGSVARNQWVKRALIAAGAGFVWLGWFGAVVAVGATPPVAFVLRRRARTGWRQRADDALPGLLDSLSAAVQAGVGIPRALHDADEPAALRATLQQYRSRIAVGQSFEQALAALTEGIGTSQSRLVASALVVGHRSGGDIAGMLRTVASVARDRRSAEREARVLTTQARLASMVVACLPVIFFSVSTASSNEQRHVMLQTPVGWLLLATAAGLECLGVLWIRKVSV